MRLITQGLLFVAGVCILLVMWSTWDNPAQLHEPSVKGGGYKFKRLAGPSFGPAYNSNMGNATIRAELGRSTWTFLHTLAARYPDEPSAEQREDTLTFIHLLARLYPCGDCASHFQEVLLTHPPRLSSKNELIAWACDVHNVINKRLDKPIFDCSTVKSRWTCGCVSEV